MVDDFKARLARKPIDAGDVGKVIEFRGSIVSQKRVDPRSSTVRDVPVRFVRSLDEAERTAIAAAQNGQAVLLDFTAAPHWARIEDTITTRAIPPARAATASDRTASALTA